MESKNLNLNKSENFESKTGDIVGMSFDITSHTSTDTTPIMDVDNTTLLFRNTSSTNKGNMLIGDDGILYSTPEALEEANKTYWENWKKINAAGGMRDLSHLRALDGSYHSNPESIKEANRRFRETYTEQVNRLNYQRTELLNQMYTSPKYALDCAGLNFIKQIHQIDPQLAQNILELLLVATKDGNFDNLETNFMKLINYEMGIQKSPSRIK